MTRGRRRPKFTLVEINAFDARRGYKRCSIPGIAYKPEYDSLMPVRPSTIAADFWRDREGNLVVRFHGNEPWVFHFKALLASGKPVPERDLEEFAEYTSDVLCDWEGTDEAPEPDP